MPDSPEREARVHAGLDEKVRSLGQKTGWIGRLLDDMRTLYELMRDKEFRIAGGDKARIVFCLLYFIMPIDLIPDFLVAFFGLGLLDDMVVVAYTIKVLGELVEKYRAFRSQSRAGDVEIIDERPAGRPPRVW